MSRRTKTWRCPGCDACTVADARPGICPHCMRHHMVLWNIAETISPYSTGSATWSRARWLEDRREALCVFCNQPLTEMVGLVLRVGLSFPVGAACDACVAQEGAA